MKIRASSNDSLSSVITEIIPEITLNGLSATEMINMKKLYDILIRKMSQGKQVASDPNSANTMLEDFRTDLNVAKKTLVLPHKWLIGNRIWKINEISKQLDGQEFDFSTYDTGASWAEIRELIAKHVADKPIGVNQQIQQMSNKFAVDTFVVVINHYKTTIEEGKQSMQHFIALVRHSCNFYNIIFNQFTCMGWFG